MRIAYVCYWNLDVPDGVTKKLHGQVEQWRARSHEVELFALRPAGPWERFTGSGRVASAVRRFSPDLVYLRYDLYLPQIAALVRRFPTVIEVNSGLRGEMRRRRPAARVYNELSLRVLLRASVGIVCVTRAIADEIGPLRKPVAVIANGIDLERVAATPPPANARPRLVYVGSTHQPWQGLDKVVRLATAAPEWDFDLVGPRDTEVPRLPPNAMAHGFLDAAAYAGMLDGADVGIGPVAMHRNGMDEASNLKVREYLAHGLPTIIAHTDTDFADSDPWFLLSLPNVERNVDEGVDEIERFVERVRGRRVERSEIEHLASRGKEAQRLAFFEDVLGSR